MASQTMHAVALGPVPHLFIQTRRSLFSELSRAKEKTDNPPSKRNVANVLIIMAKELGQRLERMVV